jgi:hypothetical protein
VRAHYQTTIVDNAGNVVTGAVVRVLNPGASDLYSGTLYNTATTTTPLANPFTSADGLINLYAEAPVRVRIGVTVGSNPEYYVEDADLLLPPAASNIFVGSTAPSSPVPYQTIWFNTTGL